MPSKNEPKSGNAEEKNEVGIAKSEHAKLRARQGRPTTAVVNDIQRAGPGDVFIQLEDSRFVVRGPKGREHIIETDGEHVTSLRRPDAAHQARLRDNTIRPATDTELQTLKQFVE